MNELRNDLLRIFNASVAAVLPERAVAEALNGFCPGSGKIIAVAAGKAAWRMAKAARDALGDKITRGIVITKYAHSMGEIPGFEIYEAGHPVPDENGVAATRRAAELVRGLTKEDTVLMLLSGGGSALFECPLVPLKELKTVTDRLLSCGADITEINTIRKRLSAVKGGRFAALASPAKVFTVVLSDVLGDRADTIASGPTCADESTCEEAKEICRRYALPLSETAARLLDEETPKEISNSVIRVTGSVKLLCESAARECALLGYEPRIVTDSLSCEARTAGEMLSELAVANRNTDRPLAFIAGGETVVRVTGRGRGGRCQEACLSAALGLRGLENAALLCAGSDGTDGPTDAAGAIADGGTVDRMREAGIDTEEALCDNDSYTAFKSIDSLVITGPTGTNVNDVSVLLIRPRTKE